LRVIRAAKPAIRLTGREGSRSDGSRRRLSLFAATASHIDNRFARQRLARLFDLGRLLFLDTHVAADGKSIYTRRSCRRRRRFEHGGRSITTVVVEPREGDVLDAQWWRSRTTARLADRRSLIRALSTPALTDPRAVRVCSTSKGSSSARSSIPRLPVASGSGDTSQRWRGDCSRISCSKLGEMFPKLMSVLIRCRTISWNVRTCPDLRNMS